MDRAYLARHLFEGKRLKRRALVEFTSALRSGRMIAFVGSYATQEIGDEGYKTWAKFLQEYAAGALDEAKVANTPRVIRAREAIHAMIGTIGATKNSDDALASLSVIEYAVAYARSRSGDVRVPELQTAAAEMFWLTPSSREAPNNVKRIVQALGIDRIITLNYDLEFEWELMTTVEEKKVGRPNRQQSFDEICKWKGGIARDQDTRTLIRTLPNGHTIISDVFLRERTDRLIEFSVGSPDQEAHVLHLHGRATDPDTMIISQRDYNRQYRRSGVARLPFERALSMLFSGNPIVFIGVGMNERDVTATLEQFISDNPNRRISPVFILWNAPDTPEQADALRFRWLHRFGVLTLFDNEILRADEKPLARDIGGTSIMAKAIEDLASRSIEHARPFIWQKQDLRSVAPVFVKTNRDPNYFDAWPPASTRLFRNYPLAAVDEELRDDTPMSIFIGEPGTGKGELAKILRERWHGSDPDRRSSIVNASFAFETDAMFSLISGLSDGIPAGDESPPKSRRKSLDNYLNLSMDQQEAGPRPGSKVLIVINGMERFFAPSGAPLSVELDALVRSLARFFRLAQEGAQALAEQEKRQEGVRHLKHLESAVEQLIDLMKGAPAGTRRLPAAGPVEPGTAVGSKADGSGDEAEPEFRIILLGTARVRRYFEALHGPAPSGLVRFADGFAAEYLRAPAEGYGPMTRSVYLTAVMDAFATRGCGYEDLSASQRALIEQKKNGDRAGIRRAVLSAYLEPETLQRAGVRSPDLCLSVLAVMAFIGQPIEDAVLAHAPRLRDRLAGLRTQAWHQDVPAKHTDAAESERAELEQALLDLSALKLIISLQKFPGSPPNWKRYGLHRSLLAELRDRHGVPLSDSQLSAGFNLSVFVAQPADGYSPERDLHHELGNLADWFIGAYKDAPIGGFQQLEDDDPGEKWKSEDGVREKIWAIMSAGERARAWPHVSACLRAALGLMRSYYSTSTLLTLDLGDSPPLADEDGPLTEHADRLDRLLQAARRHAEERRDAAEQLAKIDCEDWLATPPFYPDDLVWLHNERGVVKLAQGDLYEARMSFEEALRINREHVEFGDRGQNWRRITFNQVHVDIERGAMDRAESRLDQIEEALGEVLEEPLAAVREEIAIRYGRCPARHTHAVDPEFGHDAVLSIALIYGYRALCLHLRGHLRGAKEFFELATSILDNIGEQRAHAMFQKYSGSLYGVLGEPEDSERALRLSIASAEATRQTDVAYHARVSQAWNDFHRTGRDRAATLRKLQSALLYAEAGDMHRVRIEAGLNLARVKLDGGDYDAALEHAADAMATATRYGLSLRKISLRTLIGQILIRRGEPDAGKALLERAIKNADRINYQRAVEEAQHVLLSTTAGN